MPFSKPSHNLSKTGVQTLANVSLILFVLPPIGVALSIVALILANKSENKRATTTAVVALTINAVALILLWILVCFVKELGQAIS